MKSRKNTGILIRIEITFLNCKKFQVLRESSLNFDLCNREKNKKIGNIGLFLIGHISRSEIRVEFIFWKVLKGSVVDKRAKNNSSSLNGLGVI